MEKWVKQILAMILVFGLAFSNLLTTVAEAADDYNQEAVASDFVLTHNDSKYTIEGSTANLSLLPPEHMYLRFYDGTGARVGEVQLTTYTFLCSNNDYSMYFYGSDMVNTSNKDNVNNGAIIPAGDYKVALVATQNDGTLMGAYQLNNGSMFTIDHQIGVTSRDYNKPNHDDTDTVTGNDMTVKVEDPYYVSISAPTEIKNHTMTVTASSASGQPLQYQWYREGESIAGATSSSYTIDSYVMYNENHNVRYYCAVSNGTDTMYSHNFRFHYWGVNEVNVQFEGNGGNFNFMHNDGTWKNGTNAEGVGAISDSATTIADSGFDLSDAWWGDNSKAFAGWKLFTYRTIGVQPSGQPLVEHVPVGDGHMMTTAEVLAYKPDKNLDPLFFIAQWDENVPTYADAIHNEFTISFTGSDPSYDYVVEAVGNDVIDLSNSGICFTLYDADGKWITDLTIDPNRYNLTPDGKVFTFPSEALSTDTESIPAGTYKVGISLFEQTTPINVTRYACGDGIPVCTISGPNSGNGGQSGPPSYSTATSGEYELNWNVDNGKYIYTVEAQGSNTIDLTNAGVVINLYDNATGKLIANLNVNKGQCQLSEDGKTLTFGSDALTITDTEVNAGNYKVGLTFVVNGQGGPRYALDENVPVNDVKAQGGPGGSNPNRLQIIITTPNDGEDGECWFIANMQVTSYVNIPVSWTDGMTLTNVITDGTNTGHVDPDAFTETDIDGETYYVAVVEYDKQICDFYGVEWDGSSVVPFVELVEITYNNNQISTGNGSADTKFIVIYEGCTPNDNILNDPNVTWQDGIARFSLSPNSSMDISIEAEIDIQPYLVTISGNSGVVDTGHIESAYFIETGSDCVTWAFIFSNDYDPEEGGPGEGGEDDENKVEVAIWGQGGTFDVTTPGGTQNRFSEWKTGLGVGTSLGDIPIDVTVPTYWDPDRAFAQWEVCVWGTASDNEGNTWLDWVPNGTVLTHEEMLAYEPTENVVFKAQWSGDDGDYQSQVIYDAFGGSITFRNGEGGQWETNYYEATCWADGTTVESQHHFTIAGDPAVEGLTFECWLEFHWDGEQWNLVSVDGEGNYDILTTEEVLDRPVSQTDVKYVVKWEEINIDEYLGSTGGEGEPVNEVNVQYQGRGQYFDFTYPGENNTVITETVKDWGFGVPFGESVESAGYAATDAAWPDNSRIFEGWRVFGIPDENSDPVLLNNGEPMKTEDTMDMVMTDEYITIIFEAVWDKEDYDFGSDVEFNAHGGLITTVSGDSQEVVEGFGGFMWTDGTTFTAQDGRTIAAITHAEGFELEGWLEFTQINGEWMLTSVDSEDKYVAYDTNVILAKPVPENNVKYVAKWQGIDIEEYLSVFGGSEGGGGDEGNGEPVNEVNVQYVGWGGTFDFAYPQDKGPALDPGIKDTGFGVPVGESVKSAGYEASDAVWANNAREFLGWQMYGLTDLESDMELLTPDLMSTEETMNIVMTDQYITIWFWAAWTGADYDYGSDVIFNSYVGQMVVEDEAGERFTIDSFGAFSWTDGTTYSDQHGNVIVEDPYTDDGMTFEGWMEFARIDGHWVLISVDEDGQPVLYTTTEILEKEVPEYDVQYVAKWAEIPLEAYLDAFYQDTNCMIFLDGAGGQIILSTRMDGEMISMAVPFLDVYVEADQTILETTTEEGMEEFSLTIGKEFSSFTGWTVYEAEDSETASVPAGTPLEVDDESITLIYIGEYDGEDVYCAYLNMKLVKAGMTTEELLNMKADGKHYYALAQYKETFVEVQIPNSDQEHRLDMTENEIEIPEALLGQEEGKFETKEDVKEALQEVAEEALKEMIPETETPEESKPEVVFMEVTLKVQQDDGSWEAVTEENFPDEGLDVVIPYPEGVDKDLFHFVITHLISSGSRVGEIETFGEDEYEKTEDGLKIKVFSLSPFAVVYQEIETSTGDNSGGNDGGNTGNSGNTGGTMAPVEGTETGDTTSVNGMLMTMICAVMVMVFVASRKRKAVR